jgi:hypothetical protein
MMNWAVRWLDSWFCANCMAIDVVSEAKTIGFNAMANAIGQHTYSAALISQSARLEHIATAVMAVLGH